MFRNWIGLQSFGFSVPEEPPAVQWSCTGLSSWNILTDDVRWQGRHVHLFALRYGHKPTLWRCTELHTVQVRRSTRSAHGALAHNDHTVLIWSYLEWLIYPKKWQSQAPMCIQVLIGLRQSCLNSRPRHVEGKRVWEQALEFRCTMLYIYCVLELQLAHVQVSIKMKIAAPNASVAILAPIRTLLRCWRCLVLSGSVESLWPQVHYSLWCAVIHLLLDYRCVT